MTSHAKSIAAGMFTPETAAAKIGITTETMLDWLRAGKLTAYRFSKKVVRIKQTDLDAFIERSRA